jgi:outer membrane protein assembly factor BamD
MLSQTNMELLFFKLIKNIVKFINFFLLTLGLLFLCACASTSSDPAAIYKNQSEEQIFHGGEINVAKRNYSTAIKQFEALDALYPFGPHDEQAQLDLMYAYYQSDDVASTAATAERFVRLYPRSDHADYAYYMKGLADFYQDRGWVQRYFPTDLSQRDPGTMKQAFDDFSRLTQLYPTSVYTPDARQRMIYLRNMFANYELHAANYYFRRGAYIAAANRANYILQHYDGTPQIENALGILVYCYHDLGLNDLAAQSVQLLRINYPNGDVLKQLAKEKLA